MQGRYTVSNKGRVNKSEAYEANTGLKQGDLLSTNLFSVALEKVLREMQMETTGIAINQRRRLGFADDLNILEPSVQDTEKIAQVLE